MSSDLLAQSKPNELSPLQFELLQAMGANTGLTLSDLCQCSRISLPNGSRELKKLFELDLISKIEDRKDKRKQLLELSTAGQMMLQHAYGVLNTHAAEKYKNLSATELDELTNCLQLLRLKL